MIQLMLLHAKLLPGDTHMMKIFANVQLSSNAPPSLLNAKLILLLIQSVNAPASLRMKLMISWQLLKLLEKTASSGHRTTMRMMLVMMIVQKDYLITSSTVDARLIKFSKMPTANKWSNKAVMMDMCYIHLASASVSPLRKNKTSFSKPSL